MPLRFQTIRSAMSTRLSNSDSAGLQCYNSNLNKILQHSEMEQAGTLALIQQLHEIAGPSLLRRYQPSLLSKVAHGESSYSLVLFSGFAFQYWWFFCIDVSYQCGILVIPSDKFHSRHSNLAMINFPCHMYSTSLPK